MHTASVKEGGGRRVETSSRFEKTCVLCCEVHEVGAPSAHLGLYRCRAECILLESRNFVVMPDISPLVPQHRLLITRDHRNSFAEVPRNQWQELRAMRRSAVSALRLPDGSKPGSALVFEHGSCGSQHSGACITHAHQHLIPLPPGVQVPPIREWLADYGDVYKVRSLAEIVKRHRSSRTGYLLCDDGSGVAHLVSNLEEPVPCQYMRKMLASFLGHADWNWKAMLMARLEGVRCESLP